MQAGDPKALARSISFVENEQEGYESLLQSIPPRTQRLLESPGRPGPAKAHWLIL